MNEADQFDQCLAQASRLVSAYRAEAPCGCDPQNAMYVSAAFMVAGTTVNLIGAHKAAKAQKQQGQMSDAIAQINARQQLLNANMQLMVVKAEAKLRKRMAEAQFRLRQSEANAHFSNAAMFEQTAEARSRVARESIRRKGGEHRRMQGTQRALIGASGIVESTGTPLDLLAETAAQIQMEREEALYTDALERRSLFREADMERLGGKMALAGATLERSSALVEAGLRAAAGHAAYAGAVRESEITRLTGAARKQGYYAEAQGTLFNGYGNALNNMGSLAFKAKTYKGS